MKKLDKDLQYAHQTVLEEPTKKVETFDNKTITTIGKTKKINIWMPIFMAVVAIVSLLSIYFGLNEKKYILVKSLHTWNDTVEKITKNTSALEPSWDQETLKLSGKMKADVPLINDLKKEEQENIKELLELINSLSIDMDVQMDVKNSKKAIALKSSLKENILFDMIYTEQKNKQYLLLKNVISRYLELGNTNSVKIDWNFSYEDLDYTWSIIQKSFKKHIRASYIKKSSEKIEIDGKKIFTNKITLTMNEKNMSKLCANIVKDLKKDQRSNRFLTELYPEFKDLEISVPDKKGEAVHYSVYVKKGTSKIIMVSIYDKENKINHIIGQNEIFELLKNESLVMRAVLSDEKDDFVLTMKIPKYSDKDFIITQKIDKQRELYQFEWNIDGIDIQSVYEVNIKNTSTDHYSKQGILSIEMKMQEQSIMKFSFDIDIEIENKVNIEDVKNAVKIDRLTKEEQQKLMSYLEEIAKLLNI